MPATALCLQKAVVIVLGAVTPKGLRVKGFAKTALKAGVTALLLFLLYRKVDGNDFASAVTGMRWAPIIPFFAILFANTVLSAVRWRLLLLSDGVEIPLGKLVASYWISSFFNFFLPSNIGGDVYRIADIGRRSGSAAGSLASVFADRLCGFVTLSLAGFLFPLVGLRLIPPENRPLLVVPLVVFLGFLALTALIWQQRLLRCGVRLLPQGLRSRVGKFLDSFLSSVSACAKRPRVLAIAFAISATFQFLVFVAIWLVCKALSIPVSLGECCVFAPFVCLLEAVPLTINGIGLRDSGYALFFSAVGLAARGADPATSSATLSLCYMGLTLAYSCVGGLLFLRRMFARRASGGGTGRPSATAIVALAVAMLFTTQAGGAPAARNLPGFGKDAVYRRAPMPVPDDLARATARAERIALAAAPANDSDDSGKAAEDEIQDDPFPQFLAIAHAMMLARERHPEPVSFREMAAGAMDGIAAALDPNSDFLDETDTAAADANEDGEFDGIGVSLDPEGGVLRLYRVFPDSPAFDAGLRADDAIVTINGVAVADMEPDDAVDALGRDGEINLLCRRAEDGKDFKVTVSRRRLHFSSVPSFYTPEPGIGYIRVDEFRADTPGDFLLALSALEERTSLKGLVIDLRDNPGGVLEAAVDMAGWFLPDGAIIARTRGRNPDEDEETIVTQGEEERPELRLAILVDGGSASAAELFAAALHDNGRASLVGSRTFGKASVQERFELPDRPGAAFNLTVAHYYTPSGADLHGKGLEPDVRAWQNQNELVAAVRARFIDAHPETAADKTRERIRSAPDVTFAAALELLRGKIGQKAVGQTK